MLKKYVICIVVTLFIIYSCSASLSTRMPDDLVVEYYSCGERAGTISSFEYYYLSLKKCKYEYYQMNRHPRDNHPKITFKITRNELNSLYLVLRKNKIEKIRSIHIGYRDRCGFTFTLTYGNKRIHIDGRSQYNVAPKWEKNWFNIVEAIRKFAR